MPGTPVDLGTGTTVVFGTSGFNAEVLSVNPTGLSREAVDITKLNEPAPSANQIGNRRFKPGRLVDPGQLELEVHFDPDLNPPIHDDPETITVTFPLVAGDTTAANWAGSGFVTEYAVAGVGLDEKMTANLTVKMTGPITMTDAA